MQNHNLRNHLTWHRFQVPFFYAQNDDSLLFKVKNEIDLLIESGDTLHPVEIKTTSDPTKSMVNAFRCLDDIPGKKTGCGAVTCMAKDRLPLTDTVWIIPVSMI